jgi:pyruvate dehydrogenase E2 component (dihydrolipoamide acetyltransferase)
MPRQGQSVESCIILEWKKNEGDAVSEGEPIVEVETDKATFEVEATASGTLLKRFFEADEDVPVLTTIAVIGEEGEDYMQAVSNLPEDRTGGSGGSDGAGREAGGPGGTGPAEAGPAGGGAGRAETGAESSAAGGDRQTAGAPAHPAEPAQPAAQAAPAAGAPSAGAPEQPEEGRRGAVSPRALEHARKAGIDPYALAGSGPEGRVIERDVDAAAASGAPMTPTARAEAAATGAAVPTAGTGIGGRVRAQDLGAGAAAGRAGAAGPARAAGPEELAEYPGPVTEETARGVRKVIADRMYESLQSQAQLTLNSVADARALTRYRELVKSDIQARGSAGAEGTDAAAAEAVNITINDMILFAVSRVLPRFPEMNSHMEEYTLRRFQHVHLGFAVDTPKGLMVPTIRNADRRSLKAIARESRRLAEACTAGKATQDDLVPGTFTVSNLGNLGVTSFTPVIYAPQAGILGVGTIQPTPIFDGDETRFIPGINLSLTMDHRAVDGAPAARFLQAVAEALASFELTLAE